MFRPKLANYRAFLVDLDGVLIRGDEPLPGAAEGVETLKEIGRVAVFSNNSTRSRREFAARLQGLGFALQREEVVNSAYVAARYLLDQAGPTSVFVIGEAGLEEELELAGHRLTGPEEARFLIAGMDRGLTYEKLSQALQALLCGAEFIATNADPTFPTPQGQVPGAGAVVGAITGMGFPPEEIVGKPSPVAFKVALDAAEVGDPKECLLIGDRPETDILGAKQSGLDSALVLTGVGQLEDLRGTKFRPTWVAESLADLVGIELEEDRPPRRE